jgi:AcrR family transcriptional regulator
MDSGVEIMSKKDSILQAATVLFARKGFKATPMTEISKMTGTAEGTIFYHFKTKEDLFLAILEKFRIDVIREFEIYTKVTRFENGIHMLEGSISFYISVAEKMRDRFLLLHRHEAHSLARENAVCMENLEAIYDCFIDIFETAIMKVKQYGSFLEHLPTRKTAMIIFSTVDGLVRFDTYNLYDAASLYTELVESCMRMVENPKLKSTGTTNVI